MKKPINLVQEIKSYCGRDHYGGNLHSILFDLDVSDKALEGCRDLAKSKGDDKGVLIIDTLQPYTREERRDIIINSGVSYLG
jgi:hypothetical protein